MIKILFFGDITGEPGRKAVKKVLPGLIKDHQPDLVLANAENLAHGKGVTIKTLEELIRAGVNGFTGGNHIFSKRDVGDEAIQKYSDILVTPYNITGEHVGSTAVLIETKKGRVLVGNFMGQVFMEKQFHDPIESPFEKVTEWLEKNQQEKPVATIIDFHAEATSEKIAFGHFVDGKVSAVFGTHTHVPTADSRVLTGGTAYITDVGMCGAADSVLGVKKELSLQRFLTKTHVAFDIPEDASKAEVSYVMISVDENTQQASEIKAVHTTVDLK